MDNISYETKEVKGYTKKYVTKQGIEKETKPNKTISLGANSIFDAGDSVTIIKTNEFNNFQQYFKSNDKIKELETAIKNSSKQFQELEKNYNKQFQEFQELKKEKEELQQQLETLKDNHQKELKELNSNKDTLYNSLLMAKDKLNYYEVLITKYKTMGILKRLFKYDPSKDTPEPEPLEIPPKQ